MSRPIHPYLILLVALLLPGGGHVFVGQPGRGFGFACFSVFLGALSWQLAPPQASFIGHIAAGLFVWALSIPDAYRLARIRYETWRHSARS